MKDIEKIFNEQDKEELKRAMKNIIIEQFRSDLRDMGVYLLHPDNVAEYLQEAMEEIINDVKDEYKEIIKQKIQREVEYKLKNVFGGINK